MKKQQSSLRQQRTRTLIQLGGLVQKSGLMRALEIKEGEDLQDYESLPKAAKMLGFLHDCLERCDLEDLNNLSYQKIGERLLRYG